MEMHYAMHTPAAPLDRYVETLWYHHIPIYKAREIILPSRNMELIVNLGAAHKVFSDAELSDFQQQRAAWLAGMQSKFIVIESETSHMVGARLKPGGAAAFFRRPIDEFSDRVTPLEEILGDAAANELQQAIAAEEEDEGRFAVLEEFLAGRLQEERPSLELALAAVELIEAAKGDLTMKSVSEELEVSQKHLIEQFTAVVGLRPKQFARVIRFASLLPALGAEDAPDWAELAQLAGYHDQSHFNREFQRFAGLAPTQYLELREAYMEVYAGYEGEDNARFVPLD